MRHTTPKEAISLNCRNCNYDEGSAGTFLEQTAACECASCDLHEHRPVPRGCRKNGAYDPVAIAKVREKLDRINRERSNR
jgi:hypothetical protein